LASGVTFVTLVGMRALGWFFLFLLLAAAGVGSYWSKKRYDAYAAALEQCRGEAETARASSRDRDGDLARVSAELEQDRLARAETEKTAESVKADLSATRAELEGLRRQRAEAEQRLSAFRQVTSKLQRMIDTGKLDVVMRGGRMVVKLPAEVLFPSGKAELSPAGEGALGEVAGALKEFGSRKWMIAGHTDNRPVTEAKYKDNRELSMARALTVTEFLIKSGMRPHTLVSAGYAEFDPIGNNNTPAGRQENRRIEIVLLPNIEELPKLLDRASAAASAAPAR
jgi:chemotaxis protein MotB